LFTRTFWRPPWGLGKTIPGPQVSSRSWTQQRHTFSEGFQYSNEEVNLLGKTNPSKPYIRKGNQTGDIKNHAALHQRSKPRRNRYTFAVTKITTLLSSSIHILIYFIVESL
jgi:hypothetical protein